MFRAAPTLRLIVFGAVVLAAAVGGVVAARSAVSGLTFDQPLARYSAEKPEIRTLPDGGRIAVGSRTGHDITVQWQGPGASAWSKPHQVQREQKFWTHDIRVRQSHGTIAISPDFWVERILDDDYPPRFTTLTVCRDYRCDGSRRSGWRWLSGPEFAEQGDLVTFGLDRKTVLLWERGRGYRKSLIRGMPPRDRRVVRVMSDGSFIGLIGRWDGKQCHYVLYTAGHRSTSFRRETATPGVYDHKPCDSLGTRPDGVNAVRVGVDSLTDDIVFRRNGSTWKVDLRAFKQMQIRDTHGKSTIAPFDANAYGGQVLFGSRDRKRILMQSQEFGPEKSEKPWSRIRTIAHAPRGTACGWASNGSAPEGRSSMVLIHCYAESRVDRDDGVSDIAIVLATPDGRKWTQRTLKEARWEVVTGGTSLLAVGGEHSLLFRNGSFTVVPLPVKSSVDGVGLSWDGKHVARVIGNGNPAAECRPAWMYAAVTAKAWPAPTPFAADGYPRQGTCSASIYAESAKDFAAGVHQSEWSWDGGFEVKNGRLELAPPIE